MPVWCLDLHAAWHCRHSGDCCSAGWQIPIELPAFEQLRVHFGSAPDAGQLFRGGRHRQQNHPERPSDRRFTEAVRQADLLVVHLSDARRLTRLLAA